MQARAALGAELGSRAMQEVNRIGMSSRATAYAARELKAEDATKIAEAPSDWRRGQLSESLAESYVSRLEARAKEIDTHLWADAEVAIGKELLHTGPTHNSMAQVAREREAEAIVAAAKIKYGAQQ